jgi:iron(III) transport system permease protein
VALGAAVAFFIALCLLPAIYMLVISFIGVDGGLSAAHYRRLLTEPRQRSLFLTSVMLGAGAAVLATLVGAPLGLLLARADLRAKRLWRLALIVPLVIPPYILALAWIYLGGPVGIIAQAFGRDLFSEWTYSLAGAMGVLGANFYPLSMLVTEAAARRVDARLEEAALLVAPPRRVLWRITLPLMAPSVAAAALIVFVLAVSEFGVPGLLRVRVFTTEVFTAFAALYDFGAATALAVPLIAVTLIAGVMAKVIIGDRLLAVRRSLGVGLPLALGKWRRPVMTALALVVAIGVLLPLTALAAEAGRVERIIAAVQASSSAIANSLMLAIAGATLIVLLAVLLGYMGARARMGWRRGADLIFILLFAVPSTVVGIGLIGLWNRPGLLGEIYASPMIILIVYLARFVPVAALILAASVAQLSVSFEEAAEVAGASWPRSFVRIVIPNILTGLSAAWVVAFIFAFGELGATVLVAPPGESTLPVRVYTLIANAPSSEVAALALMQVGILLVPLVLFGMLAHSRGGKS